MSGARIPDHPRASARALRFRFDGRELEGREGDTLAAALLANGVRLVARSFKYHRPRGIIGSGFSETNALVSVNGTPNLPATRVMLAAGLDVRSLNRWPSLAFDIGAVNGLLGGLLSAGFYYKTFIWPRWELFEAVIRRAAGLGRAPEGRDPGRYDSRAAACDVLVVGGGPAGRAAARSAAERGADVLLVADARGEPPHPAVRQLARTVALGVYDHTLVTAIEDVDAPGLRQRFWKIRANKIVLACGAFERPLLFENNDRPGVMLAGAVRDYIERHGVAPGRRAVFLVAEDSGLAAADVARAAGIETRVFDLREGYRPVRAIGGKSLRAVDVAGPEGTARIACDLVAMSGGWSPAVQLASQSGAGLRFEPGIGAFVSEHQCQTVRACGAARGVSGEAECGADGAAAGLWAAGGEDMPPAVMPVSAHVHPLPPPGVKAFVDFQTDVSTDDLRLATLENYRSVEHVKRYTVWGMGVDQGKLSAVNGVVALAALQGTEPGALGVTKFRPPFAPVAFGALAAGHGLGRLFHRWKQLPAHDWHVARGAEFEDYGWLRPTHYPLPGESIEAAAQREALAVRHGAGLIDSSSFGKIEFKGPEAGRFLDLMSVGSPSTIPVGRIRYNLLTDELGTLIDDGVVARLAEDHFLMTASSGHAERVFRWMEQWHQCEWPLDVVMQDVTGKWAVLTLAGPRARTVLDRAQCDIDTSAFPHNAMRQGHLAGAPVRIQRVSFTGEPSYEIAVAADRAEALAEWLMQCGAAEGLIPFGLEALDLLRLEKGYIHVGGDTDSRTQPADIGWGKGIARKQSDFVGKRSLLHAASSAPGREQLVGLQPVDARDVLPVGAHIIGGKTHPSQGIVTSSGFSPALRRGLSLALLEAGQSRMGEVLTVWSQGRKWQARVSPVCPFDPQGERLA
ncbi:2Fe-2S iron-sulfur cluster-binding protein [Sphingosinicella soli]|uniref:Sarcosine oxidase subunit alpha n=1 Tax=Sphingosinicella soli TaxID=333708 RepID=A0A7W7B4C3_9SPHN|nr:2Fe-2S iron-sulfur cluster-binding protein [Sphingosinicella soli]MBB4633715.1 sarcosine oxidase subunit alpha [Sphingosinicella soli]